MKMNRKIIMAGLRFKVIELVQETKAMITMGTGFFDSRTSWALDQFLRDLQRIGSRVHTGSSRLVLQCLHTKPSDKYEAGRRRGGKRIHAVIAGTWDLRPLEKREIEFCGIASTKVELYASDDPNERLAMWRLELGAEDSPGCYVHAQILGDTEKPPFPKSLPIPRLPSLFVTPMSAVEFVLCELFQDDWAKAIAKKSHAADDWRALQKKWLHKLFSWYREQIEKAGSSSWVTLKEAKPKHNMFLPR